MSPVKWRPFCLGLNVFYLGDKVIITLFISTMGFPTLVRLHLYIEITLCNYCYFTITFENQLFDVNHSYDKSEWNICYVYTKTELWSCSLTLTICVCCLSTARWSAVCWLTFCTSMLVLPWNWTNWKENIKHIQWSNSQFWKWNLFVKYHIMLTKISGCHLVFQGHNKIKRYIMRHRFYKITWIVEWLVKISYNQWGIGWTIALMVTKFLFIILLLLHWFFSQNDLIG